jgi:hypothetical protein
LPIYPSAPAKLKTVEKWQSPRPKTGGFSFPHEPQSIQYLGHNQPAINISQAHLVHKRLKAEILPPESQSHFFYTNR